MAPFHVKLFIQRPS